MGTKYEQEHRDWCQEHGEWSHTFLLIRILEQEELQTFLLRKILDRLSGPASIGVPVNARAKVG